MYKREKNNQETEQGYLAHVESINVVMYDEQ